MDRSQSTPPKPGENTPLENRLEYFLAHARNAGFDSMDGLVSQYYTADFSADASLLSHQRISRKRHLPKTIAEIQKSARSWSIWERERFQHEILRMAERLLVEELRSSFKSGHLQRRLETAAAEFSARDNSHNVGRAPPKVSMMPVCEMVLNEVSDVATGGSSDTNCSGSFRISGHA